jgi:hypothetical protein
MKHSRKTMMASILIAGAAAFTLTSCYEVRYVHHYRHHTRDWYGRRHMPPPAGVNFEVDVYQRRY